MGTGELGQKLNRLLNAVLENRQRICRMEASLDALAQGDRITDELLHEANERAVEELREQFPDANIDL